MGLIRARENFCYIECDTPNCNRKMEHVDVKILLQVARLCGWERRGTEWICPECVKKEESFRKSGRRAKSKKKKKVIQV